MWRFLNNIPRALKNYHGPRASIGVYVESDDKEQESAVNQEIESQSCVAQTQSENCFCPFKNANIKGTTILWRLVGHRNHNHKSGDAGGQHNESGTSQESHQEWWSGCQKEFWTFLQGPNRIYEALAAGSSFLWSPDHKKKGQRRELVYRVLFSVYGENANIKNIISNQDEAVLPKALALDQTLLAIKDASGSEQDRIINQAKSETLDSALKEFEYMCTDYTSRNESLLGIMAADEGDMSDAVKHFHTACAHGNKTACFNIGLCYEMGTGVSRNLEKAKHYYELAAVKGHGHAMYNLSLLYLNEDGLVEGRGDREKGLEWMEMAARAGIAQAQTHMGVFYMEEMCDAKKAVAYFRASAIQNDIEAQYFLALCHEHGLEVEVNECWAAHLYSLAASGGHDNAIYNLARFHEQGLGGIPSDAAAATELYTRAAELGNEEAKIRLEELKELEKEKVKRTLLDDMKDEKQGLKTQPLRPSLLNSSSSSPNLTPFGFSLTDWVYQRVCDFYQTCADTKDQMLFGQGGEVCFQIRGDDDEICYVNASNIGKSAIRQECSPLHKSNTTPDLSSLVACNI